MSSLLAFAKYQGAGNDFLLVDGRRGEGAAVTAWEPVALAMCDRHYGVGADGLLVAGAPSAGRPDVVARMRMFNPDGSEAEMCGNGLRCFARWLVEQGETQPGRAYVETGAGVLAAETSSDGHTAAWMGRPGLPPAAGHDGHGGAGNGSSRTVSVALDGAGDLPPLWRRTLHATCISMGNPHAVFFVDDVSAVPLSSVGPMVEHHPLFPERTNVEFVEVVDPHRLRVRVWERGAGETLACGTGACAALVAARLHGHTGDSAALELPGGVLEVTWPGGPAGDAEVVLRGPAVHVFDGAWPLTRQPGAESEPGLEFLTSRRKAMW